MLDICMGPLSAPFTFLPNVSACQVLWWASRAIRRLSASHVRISLKAKAVGCQ